MVVLLLPTLLGLFQDMKERRFSREEAEDTIARILELRIQIKHIKTFCSIQKFPCKSQMNFL